MFAAKNNWFQRSEKEGIWRRVPFPCWPKAAAAEVISAGLPCITPFIQKMALFFSLPRHVHYSWGQCLPCDSRNEVWFITEDVNIIDQTRGGVDSLSLFGLGVVFCACGFSGSRVLYPIQLNRIKWKPLIFFLFVCLFVLNLMPWCWLRCVWNEMNQAHKIRLYLLGSTIFVLNKVIARRHTSTPNSL